MSVFDISIDSSIEQMQPFLILGTRPFSTETADVASEVPGHEITAYVENLNPERCNETLDGKPSVM